MRPNTVRAFLLGLWLASFVACILIVLYFRRDIPSNFSNLLKEVMDTFSQTIAAMLGYIFAGTADAKASRTKVRRKAPMAWIALTVSIIYVGLFDGIMIGFATHRLRAVEAVSLFREVRPYLAFLIAGAIAFYFSQQKSQEAGAV